MITPRPVSGIDPLASWLERMRQWMKSEKLLPGPGYRKRQTPDGYVLDIIATGGAGGGSGSSIQLYQITSLTNPFADTFNAKVFDGTSLSGSDIVIAKQYEYRPSITSELWDGVAIAYAYSDNNHRTATDPSNNTQREVCYPRFAVGKNILCAQVKSTGIANVTWIDLTNRLWQRMYVQPG